MAMVRPIKINAMASLTVKFLCEKVFLFPPSPLALFLSRLWSFALRFIFGIQVFFLSVLRLPSSVHAMPLTARTHNERKRPSVQFGGSVVPDKAHGVCVFVCLLRDNFFLLFRAGLRYFSSFFMVGNELEYSATASTHTMRKTWKFIGKIVGNSLSTQAIVTADSIEIRIEVVRRHY